METRKIIKFGNSSYVLTIPSEWMEENNLKKGNELNLLKNKKSLTFSIIEENKERIAKINLDGQPLKVFNRKLISYYLKNFRFIEIIGKDILDKIDQIKVFQEKLSSVEIVEMNDNKIILKDLTSPEELNLEKILNEIINMIKMLFSQFVKKTDEDKKTKKHYFISQLDSNINKLTFLAYKSINYNLDNILNTEQIKSSIHYWRIISSFEHIGDIIKRIARYLRNTDEKNIFEITKVFLEIENYFNLITSMLNLNSNLDNNLKLALDKKQTILREIEKLKDNMRGDLNLYLVISQLFKDIIGQLEVVNISIIDIKTK